MDGNAILNYPGSKRKLLDFIFENLSDFVTKEDIILDIFSGTGCVAKMFKDKGYSVCTNDSENYSCNIASAILNGFESGEFNSSSFYSYFSSNYKKLSSTFSDQVKKEEELIANSDDAIIDFDANLPKIWNLSDAIYFENIPVTSIDDLKANMHKIPFCLFTLYYSGSYFGLKQSMEIDSLRYAIEQIGSQKETLLTCLYYAMKEATFSKDGHMAQPLNHEKNFSRLLKMRRKSIRQLFEKQLDSFKKYERILPKSCVYNKSFLDLIEDEEIMKKIQFIYADPPYTDMQYSRYFHLLTTITNYEYPEMTAKGSKMTTGLYANNRFQSSISNRRSALSDLSRLISVAANKGIGLAFSYAYPIDRDTQPTNRYTMCIDDLIAEMERHYTRVEVRKENYKHCNNRNSSSKKVYEYLIIGVPK